MEKAISVKNLVKAYGNNVVIRGISFDVNAGEIFALLGTNGAGKSTTLEIMEGLRRHDGGQLNINGKIGVQLQSSSLPENITVLEAIQLFSYWKKEKVDASLHSRFGLDNLLKKQYKTMSMGQKRRLHLALALIGNPDIVFLDEPTAGLDVEGRAALHEQIKELKIAGKTIVMASHDMAEVETLCDRIAILDEGVIAFIGSAKELTAHVGKSNIVYIKTDRYECEFITENICEDLLTRLAEYKNNNVRIIDINTKRKSLEQEFINIARRVK